MADSGVTSSAKRSYQKPAKSANTPGKPKEKKCKVPGRDTKQRQANLQVCKLAHSLTGIVVES